LAPALRVGWIVMPEAMMHHLSIVKEASDIDTSTFTQRTISAFLDAGELDDHIARLKQAYGARRDVMVQALTAHLPTAVRFSTPRSGVFIWAEINAAIDTQELLKQAIDQAKVAFIPGTVFDVNHRGRMKNCMRLNFSYCAAARIEEGIGRLALMIKEKLARHG
jgi:2-aminoadipate transaminase